jgi:hypothetical protein
MSQNCKEMLQSRNFLRHVFATWRHVAKNRKKMQFFGDDVSRPWQAQKIAAGLSVHCNLQLSSEAALLPICNAKSLGPLASVAGEP